MHHTCISLDLQSYKFSGLITQRVFPVMLYAIALGKYYILDINNTQIQNFDINVKIY